MLKFSIRPSRPIKIAYMPATAAASVAVNKPEYIPPRMMTGIKTAGREFHIVVAAVSVFCQAIIRKKIVQ